jgi:hypothetical protein
MPDRKRRKLSVDSEDEVDAADREEMLRLLDAQISRNLDLPAFAPAVTESDEEAWSGIDSDEDVPLEATPEGALVQSTFRRFTKEADEGPYTVEWTGLDTKQRNDKASLKAFMVWPLLNPQLKLSLQQSPSVKRQLASTSQTVQKGKQKSSTQEDAEER